MISYLEATAFPASISSQSPCYLYGPIYKYTYYYSLPWYSVTWFNRWLEAYRALILLLLINKCIICPGNVGTIHIHDVCIYCLAVKAGWLCIIIS